MMNKDHFAHKRRAIMLRIANTERMLRFDHDPEHEVQAVSDDEQHSQPLTALSQRAQVLSDFK